MSKKKEDKKLTKDQAEKKILTLKKDLFNIRFKKINNQIKLIVGLQPDHPDRIKKLDDVIKIFKKKEERHKKKNKK